MVAIIIHETPLGHDQIQAKALMDDTLVVNPVSIPLSIPTEPESVSSDTVPYGDRHQDRLIESEFVCCARRRQSRLIVLAVLILAAMGRNWWCEARDVSPWASDIGGRHNSQHLSDPYSFTHFLHGIGFYWLLWFGLWIQCASGSWGA